MRTLSRQDTPILVSLFNLIIAGYKHDSMGINSPYHPSSYPYTPQSLPLTPLLSFPTAPAQMFSNSFELEKVESLKPSGDFMSKLIEIR